MGPEVDQASIELQNQEKLIQRREARRRKILDNAKSRMEKLGVKTTNFETQDNYSDPEVEPNEPKFTFNKFLNSSDNTNPSERYDPFAKEKPVEDSFIIKYRLHVLVSATLTHILALLGFMGNGNFSVLIPTCICMGLEVVLRKPKPVNPITALIVTLCKLPATGANVIWRLTGIANDLVVDLGLTIFCIVFLTIVNDYLKGNNLSTLQ